MTDLPSIFNFYAPTKSVAITHLIERSNSSATSGSLNASSLREVMRRGPSATSMRMHSQSEQSGNNF